MRFDYECYVNAENLKKYADEIEIIEVEKAFKEGGAIIRFYCDNKDIVNEIVPCIDDEGGF